MEQFRQTVLEYVQLADEVSQASKALGGRRKRLKELRGAIIEHMTEHNIEQCNLRDGTLVLRSSKAALPLSAELMVQALQEELGQEKATALAHKVAEHRDTRAPTRQSLKRTRLRSGDAPEAT